jgi:ABC-type sugar transport system substrate-binding protein
VRLNRIDRREFLELVGVSTVGLGLAACGVGSNGSNSGPKRVGIPSPLAQNGFYVEQYKNYRLEASRHGLKVDVVDAAGNQLKQVEGAETMLAQGYNALILDYFEPEPFLGVAIEAKNKNIGVFALAGKPLTHATQNWVTDEHAFGYGVGQTAGKWVMRVKGGQASVGIGTRPDNSAIGVRVQGFIDGIKSVAPNVVIAGQAKALGAQEAAATVANLLQAHPDIRVWYMAGGDEEGLAALTPLAEKGFKTADDAFVGCTNASDASLQKIGAGDNPLQATAASVANTFGAVAIMREVEKWLDGQKVSPTIKYGGVLVTKDNAGQYKTWTGNLEDPNLKSVYDQVITPSSEESVTPGQQKVP